MVHGNSVHFIGDTTSDLIVAVIVEARVTISEEGQLYNVATRRGP